MLTAKVLAAAHTLANQTCDRGRMFTRCLRIEPKKLGWKLRLDMMLRRISCVFRAARNIVCQRHCFSAVIGSSDELWFGNRSTSTSHTWLNLPSES